MGIIAEAIKHMHAAGMQMEAIVEAVAAMEAAMPVADTRSVGAIRQERYRRNKASQSVTPLRSVTQEDSPLMVSTPSLIPLKENPLKGGKEKSQPAKTRLPHDAMPEGWKAEAMQERGWKAEIVQDVWVAFAEHWQGKKGQKATKSEIGWSAAWRNWYRGQKVQGVYPPKTVAKPELQQVGRGEGW